MKKRYSSFICIAAIFCLMLGGCGGINPKSDADNLQNETIYASEIIETQSESETEQAKTEETQEIQTQEAVLEDGIYTVDFDTDSGMFHVSEACDGKGTLTVTDGEMMLHISLASKNILNLFPGLAEDAQKEGAEILEPTLDTVTYSDGLTEEVYGFDVPVPVLEEEFDLALIGKKEKWYDHKVRVSNPVKTEDEESTVENEAINVELEDGEYAMDVVLEGGSGRATIASPAVLLVKDGKAYARIEWSSPNYDYMKLGEKTYYPVNTEGNSVFELPISAFNQKIDALADTVAMGTPHEIAYTLEFDMDSAEKEISPSLAYTREMKLDYAEEFTVDYYDGGYALITVSDGSRFLVVPKEAEIPEHMEEDIVILKQPITNIYLAASAVMDMFVSMDAVDCIRLSGTKEEGWYIEEAKEAMASGKMSYAGKYNMPDYERILDENCSLAIESTMLLHSPEVKENLESFGIPVFIDRSSYETHPLGRTEWVKLYGVLLGKEKEAEAVFEQQKSVLDAVVSDEKQEKTVAFFFITSNGMVNVRKSGDYVPKMIELAGGKYVFSDLGDDTASSSVNMQMEEFYAKAKDADYLVYNSTIDGGVFSKEELLQKSPLLEGFKAFADGNVFCTTQNLYQESMKSGTFILDMHRMLTAGKSKNETFSYLFRLE